MSSTGTKNKKPPASEELLRVAEEEKAKKAKKVKK